MPGEERRALYDSWAQIYNDLIREQLQEAVQAHEKCQKQLQVANCMSII